MNYDVSTSEQQFVSSFILCLHVSLTKNRVPFYNGIYQRFHERFRLIFCSLLTGLHQAENQIGTCFYCIHEKSEKMKEKNPKKPVPTGISTRKQTSSHQCPLRCAHLHLPNSSADKLTSKKMNYTNHEQIKINRA